MAYENGSIGTIAYYANGDRALPKERIEVFSLGRTAVIGRLQGTHGLRERQADPEKAPEPGQGTEERGGGLHRIGDGRRRPGHLFRRDTLHVPRSLQDACLAEDRRKAEALTPYLIPADASRKQACRDRSYIEGKIPFHTAQAQIYVPAGGMSQAEAGCYKGCS